MLRIWICGFFLPLAVWVYGLSDATAQPIDRWHYIDADSVLHNTRVDGLQGAGVIQGDATFAMLYLGLPGENGVVSVALPQTLGQEALLSSLVGVNGQRFDRALAAEELDIAKISETTIAYSFPITAHDIGLFKSAQTWVLSIGDKSWPITLTGSRDAIETAERHRATALNNLAKTDPTSD